MTDVLEQPQSDIIIPLVLDLLEWLSAGPRPYADVIEAWRTSCPRLTIWEDACDMGLVVRRKPTSGPLLVELTPTGFALLNQHGRLKPQECHGA
jgi:hypothetical protein